ncbi:hypothetical protein [Mycolicibacterium sphagni]|uniref:hypothetical protein n=1 Tax=Mycolicibacterium sphagni TaxID=1786 RepID=UPI0021F31FD8|nr:hypothetical protein [Mycolicibacterium sphagni]MCV7174918.1 hypothetical protein [Mycolicibacterium sphagni]
MNNSEQVSESVVLAVNSRTDALKAAVDAAAISPTNYADPNSIVAAARTFAAFIQGG